MQCSNCEPACAYFVVSPASAIALGHVTTDEQERADDLCDFKRAIDGVSSPLNSKNHVIRGFTQALVTLMP